MSYSRNDLFEQKVKSLAEFCIIKCLNDTKVTDQINSIKNLKLYNRGGDALNYYFTDFFPTHDWDFGLVTLTDSNFNVTQDEYTKRVTIVTEIGRFFTKSLIEYFSNNVINKDYSFLQFSFRWINNRLANITFRYIDDLTKKVRKSSIIDLYIHDNVVDYVRNTRILDNTDFVHNELHWSHKITNTDNVTLQQILDSLPNYKPFNQPPTDTKTTLFINKIETVVQDTTTNVVYISPGDLFNDTVRMVYSSIYNININHNKLVKYTKKLSNLIDVFNNVGICPNSTCTYDVTTKILSRDTNTLNCNGETVNDINSFKNQIINSLEINGWLTIKDQSMIDLMSSKKLCEIMYVLNL